MKYYLNICKIGVEELVCLEEDCCRKSFWNKDIEISRKFYLGLVKHKQAMLVPEIHHKDNLVLNFHEFFDRTIEFTVITESRLNEKITLVCELNSFFSPTNSQEEPF